MDLSALSDDQLKALYSQPQATPLASMSDEQLKALYTKGSQPDKIGGVGQEISRAFNENLDTIKNAGPGSVDPKNYSSLQQTLNVGKAIGAIPGLIASPITGAARSLIGRGFEAASPLTDEQRKQYGLEGGRQVADLAMMGVSPRGVSPVGPRMQPAPTPSPADVKTAATDVYNDPSIRATPVQPNQLNNSINSVTSAPQFQKFNALDEPKVFRALDDMRAAGSVPSSPTVGDLDQFSSRLGKYAGETQLNQTSRLPEATPQAAAAMQVKRPIDDLIRQAAPEWQTADANYSAYKASNAFDRKSLVAALKAAGGNGDYTAKLRSAATQMLADARSTRGWSPENIAQLQSISRGTPTQNALSWFGDLLGNRLKHGVGTMAGGAAGFAGGGPVGAAAGAMGGAAADALVSKSVLGVRNMIAQKQADKLVQSLLKNSPYAKSLAPVPAPAPNPIVSAGAAPVSISQLVQLLMQRPTLMPSRAEGQQ